jgi:hypothetical protein
MFRRSAFNIIRDPILYLGRCAIFLFCNTIFALVYLRARQYEQDQALNKMWLNIWLIAIPSNMGVVAVYALNDEFKTILRESKNGMVGPLSYVFAKSLLVIPIMFVFAIFALAIPAFAIMDFPIETFGVAIILWACLIFVFECVAECLSVWFDDPILGMLQFMNFWFGSFLFAGFLIPLRDMYWPFELFYYIMPYGYYLRSSMYNFLQDTTWDACDPGTNTESAVCVTPPDGKEVLGGINLVYAIVDNEDTIAKDIGILLAIAFVYKFLYIVGVFYKTTKVASINE